MIKFLPLLVSNWSFLFWSSQLGDLSRWFPAGSWFRIFGFLNIALVTFHWNPYFLVLLLSKFPFHHLLMKHWSSIELQHSLNQYVFFVVDSFSMLLCRIVAITVVQVQWMTNTLGMCIERPGMSCEHGSEEIPSFYDRPDEFWYLYNCFWPTWLCSVWDSLCYRAQVVALSTFSCHIVN